MKALAKALKDPLLHPMHAVIISMPNDHTSTVATRRLTRSIEQTKSFITPMIMPATTPETIDEHLSWFGKSTSDWSYPSTPGQVVNDIRSGMRLSAYNAKDINKVIACAVSHMRAWLHCIRMDGPLMVLEHDALFTRRFDVNDILSKDVARVGIIGLNNPIGATRKGRIFDQRVRAADPVEHFGKKDSETKIKVCPWVDNDQMAPQGIAGNSAYIITPKAAIDLLQKIEQFGIWPNDAIMCKQFLPYLYSVYPYYTQVQGICSTTQG